MNYSEIPNRILEFKNEATRNNQTLKACLLGQKQMGILRLGVLLNYGESGKLYSLGECDPTKVFHYCIIAGVDCYLSGEDQVRPIFLDKADQAKLLESCAKVAHESYSAVMTDIDFEGNLMDTWETFSENPLNQECADAWRFAIKQAIEFYQHNS